MYCYVLLSHALPGSVAALCSCQTLSCYQQNFLCNQKTFLQDAVRLLKLEAEDRRTISLLTSLGLQYIVSGLGLVIYFVQVLPVILQKMNRMRTCCVSDPKSYTSCVPLVWYVHEVMRQISGSLRPCICHVCPCIC